MVQKEHMSREIKFRIWNDKEKQWIHGPHKDPSLDGVNLFGETIMFGELLHGVSVKDYNESVALQFTGLKDMNGKEIYEGDLVQMRYANQPEVKESFGVYEVYYDTRWAAFYLKIIKKNWFDGVFLTEKEAEKQTIDPICPVSPKLTSPLGDFRICEVIGNIFENPELLKS